MKRVLGALLLYASAAQAEPVTVKSSSITDFHRLSSSEDFGPLLWRGGLTLTSDAKQFGGFSGLVLSPDCGSLLAVSDGGQWLQGRLQYQDGRLSAFGSATMMPLLDSMGQPLPGKNVGDAEAVAKLRNGRLAVAFERLIRFGSYDGVTGRFKPIPHPKDIDTGPRNGAVEALGQLSDGSFIAIGEDHHDGNSNIRGWIWKGSHTTLFAIPQFGDYRVTDLAVMNDDTVLTLERRFENASLPGMAVRRFPASGLKNGAVVKPELLLEATAPLHVIDNMEGIALCKHEGETRLTLISDDNFNHTLQSTILLQFALKP